MDFAKLREQGIEALRQLAGETWTDHNTHDPGITILEHLCYALTDLNYRIDYDMADLLADDGQGDDVRQWLAGPEEVLTTHPVTDGDLRKVLLDMREVQNAWIDSCSAPTPVFADKSSQTLYLNPGTNRQVIELKGIRQCTIAGKSNQIESDVWYMLQANRALAQDCLWPKRLATREITVHAVIQISDVADPQKVLTDVFEGLAGHISPEIRFRSEGELERAGQRVDEIFDGPVLSRGFIMRDDLERHHKQNAIRKSDFIQVIMDVEGVRSLTSIQVGSGNTTDAWYLELASSEVPILSESSTLQLVRGPAVLLEANFGATRSAGLAPKRAADFAQNLSADAGNVFDSGRNRSIGHYVSIQEQFPAIYRLGTGQLTQQADAATRAKVRQLKAYLCLFEQLLANAFSQLAHAKDLLSPGCDHYETYYSQSLRDSVPDVAELLGDGYEEFELEDEASMLSRQHRFLNHLLARFGEEMTNLSQLASSHEKSKSVIQTKRSFLRGLPKMGRDRGLGFDGTRSAASELSALEQRLRLKLDLQEEDDFFIVEHLLLRPGSADFRQWESAKTGYWRPEDLERRAAAHLKPWTSGDCRLQQSYGLLQNPLRSDPYSVQISFVLPRSQERFNSKTSRDIARQTIRDETPAHLHVHVHWLNEQDELPAFTSDFQVWKREYSHWLQQENSRATFSPEGRDARDRMIDRLRIGSPWPRRDVDIIAPQMSTSSELEQERGCIELHVPQAGVEYTLCDLDGTPVLHDGKQIVGVNTNGVQVLRLPPMNEDQTFTVRASWQTDDDSQRLAYLQRTIRIRAGVNVFLVPRLTHERNPPELSEGNEEGSSQLKIDYEAPVYVAIQDSQQGVSYEVVNAEDPTQKLSELVEGKGPNTWIYLQVARDLESLKSGNVPSLQEDTRLRIRVVRTSDDLSAASFLTTDLQAFVRPNPNVTVDVQAATDYDGKTVVELRDQQDSVNYTLFRRSIDLTEFLLPEGKTQSEADSALHVDGEVAEMMDIGTVENQVVKLPHPLANAGDVVLSDFATANQIKVGNKQFDATAVDLVDEPVTVDTLYLVRASKKGNGETLWLRNAHMVLVKPDRTVKVDFELKEDGQPARVVIEQPQNSVRYQLIDENSNPVGEPGYPLPDRGIGRSRIAVDFEIPSESGDSTASDSIVLPVPLDFNGPQLRVLATRYVPSAFHRSPPLPLVTPIPLQQAFLNWRITLEAGSVSRIDETKETELSAKEPETKDQVERSESLDQSEENLDS